MRMRSALMFSLLVLVAGACGASGTSDASNTTASAPPPSSSEAPPPTDDEATTTTVDEATTTTGPSGGADADAFAASLALGLENGDESSGDISLDAEGAECVAPRWIDIIGVDTLDGAGFTPKDLEDSDFGFDDLKLDLDQGYEMIDVFADCDVDIRQEFLASVGSDLDSQQKTCLDGQLDPTLLRDLLANSLVTTDLPPDLESQFEKIGTTCKLGN